MRPLKSTSWFTRFAKGTARATGKPLVFGLTVTVILLWAITGPPAVQIARAPLSNLSLLNL